MNKITKWIHNIPSKGFISLLFLLDSSLTAPHSWAEVLLKPEDVLQATFAPSSIEIKKINVTLTPEERKKCQETASTSISQDVIPFFEIRQVVKTDTQNKNKNINKDKSKPQEEGPILGYAGLYTSVVRKQNQTVLVLLNPQGTLLGVEIIAFYEHSEYLPPQNWNLVFKGKPSTAPLQLGNDIPIVTGATMTTERISQTARIIRAIWQVKWKSSQKKKK